MPTETDICNLAGGKLGGFGAIDGGNAFIVSIDGTDLVSSWCKLNFPRVRRRVITDLASKDCAFRLTKRFLDMGSAIDDDDTPEIGQYQYAFNLPGDCLEVASQFDENYIAQRVYNGRQSPNTIVTYDFEILADKDGNGKILVTNVLTNLDRDSAFIEYAIDTPNTGGWSEEMIECVATLLSSEICPVVGRDMETANAQMAKYLTVAIPAAQRANQRGQQNDNRPIKDYSGGRTSSADPTLASDLGTYVDATGNRRSI